ncbi:hypothetical protein [Limnoglobus roseus]|uniref:Uncharacterized protein n=1 Tax=Limnoglobus roseus TaxID=2598579 RepID=A0A5C1A8I9_9BACT|nr:hypothetical protein [Limnoglobus roseus]QEL14326.1 hypothetical protein PX52LOC_01206 [Limnoglobus roseus]
MTDREFRDQDARRNADEARNQRTREALALRETIAVAKLKGDLACKGQKPTPEQIKAAKAAVTKAWMAEQERAQFAKLNEALRRNRGK